MDFKVKKAVVYFLPKNLKERTIENFCYTLKLFGGVSMQARLMMKRRNGNTTANPGLGDGEQRNTPPIVIKCCSDAGAMTNYNWIGLVIVLLFILLSSFNVFFLGIMVRGLSSIKERIEDLYWLWILHSLVRVDYMYWGHLNEYL